MQAAADFINQRYGELVVEVEVKDQYYNMRKMIEPHPEIIEVAKGCVCRGCWTAHHYGARRNGWQPALIYGLAHAEYLRRGHAMHGRYEFVPVESMEKAVEVILKIAELATA